MNYVNYRLSCQFANGWGDEALFESVGSTLQFVGQRVALVLAASHADAEAGAALVTLAYGPPPPSTTAAAVTAAAGGGGGGGGGAAAAAAAAAALSSSSSSLCLTFDDAIAKKSYFDETQPGSRRTNTSTASSMRVAFPYKTNVLQCHGMLALAHLFPRATGWLAGSVD